ncbi:MAG: hypothetical protein JO129_02345 [Candidatus Dependentiae bacterium]|nr:hypothetical protein [Candidatus Dependentiae bacterium]
MKNLQKIAIVLSILTIECYFCAASQAQNIIPSQSITQVTPKAGPENELELYYSYPNDTQGQENINIIELSYIDTNTQTSFLGYIIANPYPVTNPKATYLGNSQFFPYTQYFQPADGSMTNGTFDVTAKTATTALHNYKNIFFVDGSLKTPRLSSKGKYIDKKGNQYDLVGSLQLPSEDASEINSYYIFGTVEEPIKSNIKNIIALVNNKPTQTYYSQGE